MSSRVENAANIQYTEKTKMSLIWKFWHWIGKLTGRDSNIVVCFGISNKQMITSFYHPSSNTVISQVAGNLKMAIILRDCLNEVIDKLEMLDATTHR